jgi:putative DNA methylase
LFPNYIIAKKSPSVRYVPDYQCVKCKKTFDLDMTRTSLIAEESLMINNPGDAVGEKRNNKRWASYNSMEYSVKCPWCEQINNLHGSNLKNLKKARKKVPLTILLCPHCYAVWQYRGTLPEEVSCPVCSKSCKPLQGNTGKGAFICPSCGTKDKIINSIRKLPENQLLPTRPYAVEGYCAECAGDTEELDLHGHLTKRKKIIAHQCDIHNNRGKFFKRITPADLKKYQNAEKRWEEEKDRLPYPKSEIPDGQETHRLLEHHYAYWHQMFNFRQLLCLSTLLKGIGEENDQVLKEMLLSGFFNLLNNMSDFCTYIWQRDCIRQVFARHDFQPKATICESNVWGTSIGMGTFVSLFDAVIKGKNYNLVPFDRKIKENKCDFISSKEKILGTPENCNLECTTSQNIKLPLKASMVITDPPYAGNVNYSELADFFYVWLRLILSRTYPHFAPEITPKAEEIIENPTRGKTTSDYQEGLTEVWRRCCENLKDDGLMVFTFHHREGSACSNSHFESKFS